MTEIKQPIPVIGNELNLAYVCCSTGSGDGSLSHGMPCDI